MSNNLPPKWSRRSNRWRCLLALCLIGLLSHPLAGAYAQSSAVDKTFVNNEASATYTTENGSASTLSNKVSIPINFPLIDPGGRIFGCDGKPLDSYRGFSTALYEPDASGLDLGNLLSLTPTNGSESIPPNSSNVNPFSLSASDGRYNFLLDSGGKALQWAVSDRSRR